MSRTSAFQDLVSGRRRGLTAAGLRALLRVAAVPYAAIMRFRNWRFDTGRSKVVRVDAIVISVGNISMGGTGKTPLVEWLARWLRARGVRVTIVSRGYGASQGARNDEALELEQKLPDVPHVQNPDRVAAARMAIEEFACRCLVLDDAFQHRRLARDLDLVLVDALEPAGCSHVFPRGTLREPLGGLGRAQVVILSRADLVSAAERAAIRRRVMRHAPGAAWLEAAHAPRRLLNYCGEEQPCDWLKERRVAAFCGIGNPEAFRRTIVGCGAQLQGFRAFDDHHPYERSDVEQLVRWGRELSIDALICTHKDLVKLGVERLGEYPLWAVSIELEFLSNQHELEALLEPLVARAIGPPSTTPL